MAGTNIDVFGSASEKVRMFLSKTGISFGDLLRAAFKRLCEKFFKSKRVAYTYNPLPENKRAKLGEYITTYFKNKAEFAKEANLAPTILSSLLVNRRCGNALTWKKINDAFEKHEIKLPYDLQIKYEVVGKFGEKK